MKTTHPLKYFGYLFLALAILLPLSQHSIAATKDVGKNTSSARPSTTPGTKSKDIATPEIESSPLGTPEIVVAPVILKISPRSGNAGTSVTITGVGFEENNNTVKIGGKNIENLPSKLVSRDRGRDKTAQSTITFIVPSISGCTSPPSIVLRFLFLASASCDSLEISVSNTNGVSNIASLDIISSATKSPTPTPTTTAVSTLQNLDQLLKDLVHTADSSDMAVKAMAAGLKVDHHAWDGTREFYKVIDPKTNKTLLTRVRDIRTIGELGPASVTNNEQGWRRRIIDGIAYWTKMAIGESMAKISSNNSSSSTTFVCVDGDQLVDMNWTRDNSVPMAVTPSSDGKIYVGLSPDLMSKYGSFLPLIIDQFNSIVAAGGGKSVPLLVFGPGPDGGTNIDIVEGDLSADELEGWTSFTDVANGSVYSTIILDQNADDPFDILVSHEICHALGCGHTVVPDDLMFPIINITTLTSLNVQTLEDIWNPDYTKNLDCADYQAWLLDQIAADDASNSDPTPAPGGAYDSSPFISTVPPASSTPTPISGCMDPKAENYDAKATVQTKDACQYVEVRIITPGIDVPGCTDVMATNYDPKNTIDDGSCIYEEAVVYGCTDDLANNRTPGATVDDGSCTYDPGGDPGGGYDPGSGYGSGGYVPPVCSSYCFYTGLDCQRAGVDTNSSVAAIGQLAVDAPDFQAETICYISCETSCY